MRELKFRGLNKSGEFVCGDLVHKCMTVDNKICVAGIAEHGCYPVEVDITTVGQFTGLNDVNGIYIYEGDILECEEHFYWVVQWCDRCACFHCEGEDISNLNFESRVIGNIHQNKYLIGG